MTIEDQITALLAEAEPLRCLPWQEQGELGAIVDRINALRALQASGYVESVEAFDPEPADPAVEKRKPGRPRKAD